MLVLRNHPYCEENLNMISEKSETIEYYNLHTGNVRKYDHVEHHKTAHLYPDCIITEDKF